MAEPMENGPSSCNGEAEQVWERPWTLDEMRKNSVNWSLAADSGLFLYLQDFSQRMVSKTHEIEKQLDGLIRDTKATDSCLHTVFNDFLMLSNIQFIENRVYDEEVEEPVPKTETQERRPEQEKTREQKEAELIPKIQEAVNYGLKVLESAFEQLDVKVGNSDSEDEEAADKVEPILEPKDLYVDRPLPYLIGSQAFMEQDDIGLGDLSSDEMSIDSDRESFVESEVDKDQDEHSDDDYDQEGESRGKLKKKPLSSDEDEENEDSDLFGESDKDEDEARRDDVGPASFADQLAARIKDTTKKPETDRTSLSSGTSATKRKHQGKKLPQAQVEDDDEMFKPPKMDDEEYSPFGEKGGLFSGGKGLFDDDEGDLFSEAPKKEKEQAVSQKSESVNIKKIPTGAVSIFPENGLFGSPNGSDSLESKENGRLVKSKVHAVRDQPSLGGGLFDDNEEDDDFFSGKTLKKPTPAAQKKAKPKMAADLFGGDDDDEDGDIFVGSHPAGSKQNKKVAEEEEVQPQEKKLPAGAISIFGPGTNNLLAESLKKRHPSTSEESVKSEESMPPAVVKPPVATKTTEKAQSKSLFSDDEDSQIFPTMPKSLSKPEGPAQNKPSKAKVSIFDDEEEDLFSSVPKSQSVQVKTAVSQPKKALSSSFFSDDEDQWMSSQPSPAKPGGKSGGMKSSTSAPSRLPSANTSQTDSLFNDDDDDLFVATKEPSQKKPQRVSLLFEDEDDEDTGSLFGIKQSVSKGTPEVKVPAASQAPPTLFGQEEMQEKAKEKPSEKTTMQTASSPEETNKSKKPAGAVSLFGGINVLGEEAKTTTKQSRNAVEDIDDLDWHKEAPPPMETKEKKATKNTFSLFDDYDDDEDEPDEIPPISTATKHLDKSTLKEPRTVVKSTGVFQDEELLFSQTQQKDNDPEVDLFAASAKPSTTVSSSVKPAVSALFGEQEEDDDLFSSAKPKTPPKVPNKPSKAKHEDKGSISSQSAKSQKPLTPVKPKETSSRIGKLQATLAINPASFMPGASPRTPGAVSIMPDLAQSSSPRSAGLSPESAFTAGSSVAAESGINFETPAQVTTLQNANKDRVKGATQRRPQTRAARHLAAQRSEVSRLGSLAENSVLQAGSGARTTSLPSAFNPIAARPSALTLPITTSSTTVPAKTVSDGVVRPKVLPLAEEDLFSSEDLFASASAPKHTPPSQTKEKPPETVFHGASKNKEPIQPIINDHSEDLFPTVKPKVVKKAKTIPFLDDDDDIFATETKKASKTLASSIKPEIFQDVDETLSKVLKKPKEQRLEASLFDDDVDIFADLTPVTKPKEKKAKKKVGTKSIFDDDMDDIFSSGITKPVGASTAKKSKKPVQELNSAEESGHNIFDDPLNVFGGK